MDLPTEPFLQIIPTTVAVMAVAMVVVVIE